MATSNTITKCECCNNEDATYLCRGCSKYFCLDHLKDHKNKIDVDFNNIEHDFNLFRQKLDDQKQDPKNNLFIKQIDQWEEDSIGKIKEKANEYRQILIKYMDDLISELVEKLNDFTNQIRKIQKQNDFNEIHLNQLKDKLKLLENELIHPKNVSIERKSTFFSEQISVSIPPFKDQKWKQHGQVILGTDHLNGVHGIFIDDNDQSIYIADFGNHRILQWKLTNGTKAQIVAGGNGPGNQLNQLAYPRDVIVDYEKNSLIIADLGNKRVMEWSLTNPTKRGQILISNITCDLGLAMDKHGSLYVSDCNKHEVRRWKRGESNGIIVAGGNGQGKHLNQLNYPSNLFIDEEDSLYISDRHNHRIMKWIKNAKEGIIVAGGNGKGNSLRQFNYTRGVIVDRFGQIYVVDDQNHRVMKWVKGAEEGTIVVGGNGHGNGSNQLYYPESLLFDRQRSLYVSEYGNSRIQKFEIDLYNE